MVLFGSFFFSHLARQYLFRHLITLLSVFPLERDPKYLSELPPLDGNSHVPVMLCYRTVSRLSLFPLSEGEVW